MVETVPLPEGPDATEALLQDFFVPDWPSVEELVGNDDAGRGASEEDWRSSRNDSYDFTPSSARRRLRRRALKSGEGWRMINDWIVAYLRGRGKGGPRRGRGRHDDSCPSPPDRLRAVRR